MLQVGDVPRYDRSTDEQLYFSTRKRPADTLLAAEEAAAAAGAAGRPVKRMRANSRCGAVLCCATAVLDCRVAHASHVP